MHSRAELPPRMLRLGNGANKVMPKSIGSNAKPCPGLEEPLQGGGLGTVGLGIALKVRPWLWQAVS